MALTHGHAEFGRHFLNQLSGRQLLIVLFAFVQIGPHRRVDLLVMSKPAIQ